MIDDALREYAETPDRFAPIPAGSSVSRDDDGHICIVQGTVWASISAPRFEEHQLDDVIAHVHDRVAPEKRQTWWIGPSARPANLVPLLQERGFVLAPDGPEVRAMVLTSPPPEAPDEVEVRRVETFEDFLASRDVQWEAFDVPEERREQQRPHLRSDFDESMQHGVPVGFLAYVDDRPAATALAIPSPRGVFLIAGSTARWARGRGAYRALVRARWEYAAEQGTPALVTEAMVDTSYPILQRLGFTEVCTIRRLEEAR
jgi:hypothetical protein